MADAAPRRATPVANVLSPPPTESPLWPRPCDSRPFPFRAGAV